MDITSGYKIYHLVNRTVPALRDTQFNAQDVHTQIDENRTYMFNYQIQ